MKRWLTFLLLVGAVLGLLAQEAAFASAPAIPAAATTTTAAMSDECAEMMGIDKSQDSAPCKGLTLDCIAKMGCALPLAVAAPAASLEAAAYRPAPVDARPAVRLSGRIVGPEPEPPLFRG